MGGAGVSALARLFLARGHRVSGCDLRDSATTRALSGEGVAVMAGHDPGHVIGADGERLTDLVVYSGALHAGSDELAAARAAGIPVLSRAEMLAELLATGEAVAVAGSHGKTSVTFMLGHLLTEAGRDPTVLVGDGSSSRAGRGGLLVAEADESDGTLALHRPRHGILTNVDFDHPDHFHDLDAVAELFQRFLQVIEGVALVCADDLRARSMVTGGRRVTYGFAADADYRCVRGGARFQVTHRGRPMGEVDVAVPGDHMVQNATAAIAMAVELGVPFASAAEGLRSYPGARRRMELLGSWRGAVLYDDYGHHPAEIAATLLAARELTEGRLALVFQPHRYSRYQALREEFARSLAAADEVVVTEIYGAGEPNPGGVSAAGLAEMVPGARFAPDLPAARQMLSGLVEPGDLVLLMGAGDIRSLGDELAHEG